MTEAAGYRAKCKDTTVWYLTSSSAIAESEAILQVTYLFQASSHELRSMTCRFSVFHFLADFVSSGGVCGGSRSLSKLTYLPPTLYAPVRVLLVGEHTRWLLHQHCGVVSVGCGVFSHDSGICR